MSGHLRKHPMLESFVHAYVSFLMFEGDFKYPAGWSDKRVAKALNTLLRKTSVAGFMTEKKVAALRRACCALQGPRELSRPMPPVVRQPDQPPPQDPKIISIDKFKVESSLLVEAYLDRQDPEWRAKACGYLSLPPKAS